MRIIAHLDMDAFFAAIEERDNPRFGGRPLVIGADPREGQGRGVVSTANYKARVYGIHSAMPISWAWRLAEEAVKKGQPPVTFLAGNMKKYGQVSNEIMDIIRTFVPHIEQASVDEAYLDLSFTGSYKKAEFIAKKIKQKIKKEQNLTASIGIGPNKLIAKIASDIRKPDGLYVIPEKEAESFLEPLPIRKIPGIGPKTEEKLNKLKVEIIRDLKQFDETAMKKIFGKWGGELYLKVRAQDSSPIIEDWEVKSIGEQTTFSKDTLKPNELEETIRELSKDVFERFKKSNFTSYRAVTLTVRFSDFITKARTKTLLGPGKDETTLHFESLKLLMAFLDKRENPDKKSIRLLGVRIEKLS